MDKKIIKMYREQFRYWLAGLMVFGLLAGDIQGQGPQSLPNIIFIMVDDMGYGDPKAFNSESKIATPQMDKLADSGMIFTDAHASASSCVPSRYGLLTGRYPFRMKSFKWQEEPLIDEGRMTMASVLQKNGYRTGMVGKWHLGFDYSDYNNLRGGPVDRGFDYYYGISRSLDQPSVDFPLTVMDYRARVFKEGTIPDIWETGMGSGPFKLDTLDVEGITVLVANDDYWDGPPGVAAVEVYGIADGEAQTTALLSGQLDFQGVTQDIAARFEGNSDFTITQVPSGDWSGLVMRTDIPPFDNLPLRQAMHYVLDRQELVDLSLSGAGRVSCDSAVMPSDPNVLSECSYEQDFDAARAKLEEAGYSDGFQIDLYASNICQDWEALTEIYQQQAAQAGIDVNIQIVSADGFWTEQWMVEPFVITCWNGRLADTALNEIYRGGGSWNESYWNVPEFDALLDAARAETDPEVRREHFLAAQKMLHEDGGTLIPYYLDLIRVQKACIDGIPPLPDVWIDWDGITKPADCD